jgi:hypothetical protein
VFFREGLAALVTAEALEAVSVLSKAFAGCTAIMAGHCGFPLKPQPFCRIMNLWVNRGASCGGFLPRLALTRWPGLLMPTIVAGISWHVKKIMLAI